MEIGQSGHLVSSHTFTAQRIVRFGECDQRASSIIPYFNWFHELMEEWLSGLTSAAFIQMRFSTKRDESKFFRPCAVGEQVEWNVLAPVFSFFSYGYWGGVTGKEGCWACRMCLHWVSEDGFRFAPKEIPLLLREKMEKFVWEGWYNLTKWGFCLKNPRNFQGLWP